MSDLARLPDLRGASPRQGAEIVNEATAKAFWPAGNAVGQFLSTSYNARLVSGHRLRCTSRTSRFNALVLSAFGIVGHLLSALGVFGVFAFGVASRAREVGIRMAVGATARNIVQMFLSHAMGPHPF